MRTIFIILIAAVITTSMKVYAEVANVGVKSTAFPLSNTECVAVGDITLGAQGRWSHCRVIRNGWFATIEHLDLYQSQYCLGKKAGACEKIAILLFANRAYTPQAKLLLQKIDVGAVTYDDPLTINTENGVVMELVKHLNGVASSTYYYWQRDRWVPMESQGWQEQLPKHLPIGLVTRTKPAIDISTMSAQAMLYRTKDANCCPSGGVANVSLKLFKGGLSVKSVKILPGAKLSKNE